MIKKLRIKFVMTAFLSVLAVLVILVGGINISNYIHVVNESDKVLGILSDNGGRFPEREPEGSVRTGEEPPPGAGHGARIDSPELAFETRFFTVTYSAEGDVVKTDTDKVYSVSGESAVSMADEVMMSGKESGFVYDYRYLVSETPDGGRIVIFSDRGASLANFRSFRNASAVISLLGLLIIGSIIYLISGRAVRPIEEAGEKQKRFISDAGHEIKTPLAIIRADADVLMMETGQDNEWVSDIIRQTDRLSELTNDLISLSKMEEGGSSLVTEETDLSAMAEDAADSVKSLTVMQKKEFSSDIESGVHIKCDKKAVYELMSILLDNAVKYCPGGGSISFSLSSKGKKAVFSVENDTDGSIGDEAVKHLFDRFYRTDASRNSGAGGFGIGLSVALAVTEAHKGRISAEIPREGSIRFTAIL